MATIIEYALMAGASYISTRAEINQFPIPDGWQETIIGRRALSSSGFEANSYTNGSEIVISFAGTKEKWKNGVRLGILHKDVD